MGIDGKWVDKWDMDKILTFFNFWNILIPSLFYNLRSNENLNNFDYDGLNLEVNAKLQQLVISSFKNNNNKHSRVSIHNVLYKTELYFQNENLG